MILIGGLLALLCLEVYLPSWCTCWCYVALYRSVIRAAWEWPLDVVWELGDHLSPRIAFIVDQSTFLSSANIQCKHKK